MADAPNDTLNRMTDTAEKTQDTVRASVREGAERAAEVGRESLRKATSEASRAANRGMEMGSQAMDAYAEAGRQAAGALGEVNRAATDAYSRSLSNFEELSKQAMSARTPQDLMELQSAAIQKMQDNFNDMTRVYSLFFNAFTKSVQPIANTAANTANEIRDRAKAAV